MSIFADFRRGYRRGRGAGDFSGDGPDAEGPHDFRGGGDARDQTIAALERIVAAHERTIAAHREEIAALRAQLAGAGDDDRQQAADQRTREQMREMESILAFPGVRTALAKALHPD